MLFIAMENNVLTSDLVKEHKVHVHVLHSSLLAISINSNYHKLLEALVLPVFYLALGLAGAKVHTMGTFLSYFRGIRIWRDDSKKAGYTYQLHVIHSDLRGNSHVNLHATSLNKDMKILSKVFKSHVSLQSPVFQQKKSHRQVIRDTIILEAWYILPH